MNRRESKRKSRQDSMLVGKIRQRDCRRRMTCPSASEISKAILSVPQLTKTLSLHELVMKCVHSFDDDGALRCNSQSVDMMLMMHSWIISSADFAQKLFELYRDSSPLRQRICHFIRYWITHYPAVFTVDSDLESVMLRFLEYARREGSEAHSQLIDTSNMHLQDWTQRLSLVETPNNKKRKVSLLFDHLEPGELAEHLSFLEYKAFSRISYLDYRNYVVGGSVRENPALERSISLVNGVSQWVQLMVLNRHTAAQRAEVFTKFIHVAQKLRHLQNFNTLMAVIGGLCHSAISRLKETSSFLTQDVSKALAEMTELLSSTSNFGSYRRAFGECSGFKIPVVGVHLKDLVSLSEALPDFVEGKINVSKLHQLHSRLQPLLHNQSHKPPFQANKDLLHLLTLSLDLFYTEDEIYKLSYAKEPKTHRTLGTPCKPPVLSDWGSDVIRKLDSVTVGKHVQQMVDSVFAHYDQDHDGYISHQEFEKVAAIFPFAFPLDTQREGLLSREEMTGYLMRSSALCSRAGRQHNFQENTFMRPTFCVMCTGFLWGVTKQGYRCQDCGLNCHKHCVELAMLECKKRTKTTQCESTVSTSHPHPGEDGECEQEDVKDRMVLMIGRVAHPILLRVKPPVSHQSTQTEPPPPAQGSPPHTKPHRSDPQLPNSTAASQRAAGRSGCEHCSQRRQDTQQESRAPEDEVSSLQAQVRALQTELQVLRSSQGVPTLTLIVEQMDNLRVQQAP